jgi:hypothetical protein
VIKRVFFGLLWFIVLYFGSRGVVGRMAGATAGKGAKDMQSAMVAGASAGKEAVGEVWGYLLVGAIVISVGDVGRGVTRHAAPVAARLRRTRRSEPTQPEGGSIEMGVNRLTRLLGV